MNMKRILAVTGNLLVVFVLLVMFCLYGSIIYFFKGLTIFRIGFYLPVLCIVVYLYFGKKKHRLFSKILGSVLLLELLLLLTVNLIIL